MTGSYGRHALFDRRKSPIDVRPNGRRIQAPIPAPPCFLSVSHVRTHPIHQVPFAAGGSFGSRSLVFQTGCMRSSKDLESCRWEYRQCCRDLDGQRHKRTTLRRLLAHARKAGLTQWCEALSGELMRTRTEINCIFARRTRLGRALNRIPTEVKEGGWEAVRPEVELTGIRAQPLRRR
jgi:hypothetical protein